MALNYTPTTVTSTFPQADNINTNFDNIETALSDALSRSGYGSNAMTAALDMNSNRILNVADGVNNSDGVNLNQLIQRTSAVATVGEYATVNTMADLRAQSPNNGDVVQMLGRETAGDGAAGVFRFDASDLSTEVSADEVTSGQGNGGIYVAPASDSTGESGAWVRVGYNQARPEWYGAAADGATNDTNAVQAASNAAPVVLGNGTYQVSGTLTLGASDHIEGIGLDRSIIRLETGATVEMSGAHTRIGEMGLNTSDGGGQFTLSGSNCVFENLRVRNFDEFLNVTGDSFWSKWVNCSFRDCDRGIVSNDAAGNDFNAATFVACKWQHSSWEESFRALDVVNEDGISFLGCAFGRATAEFEDCNDISFLGGYYEFPEFPVVILKNCATTWDGVHFVSGTRVDIDDASYRLISGSTIPCTTNRFYKAAPLIVGSPNVFPNPDCNDTVAVNAFRSAGYTGSVTGAGTVQFTRSGTGGQLQFDGLPSDASGISVLARIEVTAGSFSVRLRNTAETSPTTYAVEDGEVVVRIWSTRDGGAPFFLFSAQDAGTNTIEIKEFWCVPHEGVIGDPLRLTRRPTNVAPSYTDSLRPTAGVAGRIIFNTDDGQLNVDDGTSWTLPDGTST